MIHCEQSFSFFIIIAYTLAGKYLNVRVTGLSSTELCMRPRVRAGPLDFADYLCYYYYYSYYEMCMASVSGIVYIAMCVLCACVLVCVCVHVLECTYSDYSNLIF